ncbi:MAG TPA: universal stress protein [Solirubrobacteraceae bacterium]|jgi:nucleotide-binding universal stress UspA family protein
MFKNVLVGVDGSLNGRDAIALATRMAGEGSRLTLVHVHPGELHPLHAVTPGLLAEEHEASEKLLRDERAGGEVEAELVSLVAASPGAGLHRQAEEQGAELIVVGSCSRGAFGRAMIGDDTRAALNGAPCAVAIASRGYAEHPRPIANVGVGYNDSAESRAALELAREVAAPTRAEIQVLEVVSIPTYAYTGLMPPLVGEGINSMLSEARERLEKIPEVRARAVYGLTGEELAAFSDDVDVLVVGSRSYGPVKRLVLGSTSDYLERHARCSLLVLPRATATGGEAPDRESEAAAAGAV